MPFYTVMLIAAAVVMCAMLFAVLTIARLYKKPKPGFVLVIKNMHKRLVSRIGHAVIPVFHSYCEIDIRPRLLTINGQKCVIEVKDNDEDIMRFADAFVNRADAEIAAFLGELWDQHADRSALLAEYGLRLRNAGEDD